MGGPVRMSRSPGGGSTKGSCSHGETGARGMGSQYSGGKNGSNKLSWNDPKRAKGKDHAKVVPVKRQPDNYYKLSRNPSGASNAPVRTSGMDMDWRDRDL